MQGHLIRLNNQFDRSASLFGIRLEMLANSDTNPPSAELHMGWSMLGVVLFAVAPWFLFQVWILISWRFLGEWMCLLDGRWIMHLGQMHQNRFLSGELGPPPDSDFRKRMVVEHLCILSHPQIPSIHVICTLTDYYWLVFVFFCSLDWFWDGRTSNTNILCLVLFYWPTFQNKSP
jgi:hypothetical protein